MHEHLLEFETAHGRRQASFERNESALTINDLSILVDNETTIADLPLDGFDIVINFAGTFGTGKAIVPLLLLGYIKRRPLQ